MALINLIKHKYSGLIRQEGNLVEAPGPNGEQSNYLSESSKHQSQFRDCLTFCGSRFKSLNEKRGNPLILPIGDSKLKITLGIANIGSAFRSALASIPQENSVTSPSKETVIETGAQHHPQMMTSESKAQGAMASMPINPSTPPIQPEHQGVSMSTNLGTSGPQAVNFSTVAQNKVSLVMTEDYFVNPRGTHRVRGDIVSPVNRGGHANNGKVVPLKQVHSVLQPGSEFGRTAPLLIGISSSKDKSTEPSPAKTAKGVQSSKTFMDGYKLQAGEEWKNSMVTIDDLQESCSSPSENDEEDDDYLDDQDKVAVMKIDPNRFHDKRVQFMLRVYRGRPESGYAGITVPRLEVNRIMQQLVPVEPTTMMSKVSKRSEAHKYYSIKNISVLEQIFVEKFLLFVRSAFSDDQKTQEYMMDNFDELYQIHGEKEPSIERVLMILKSLADCGFNQAPELTPSRSSGQPLDKKSLLILHHIDPEKQPRQVMSRVATIDVSPSVGTRIYKAQLTNQDVPEPKIPLKTYGERVTESFKLLTSMEKGFHNSTKKGFAYFYDNMDLNTEYPTRSNNDSPAKSARSINTTKRKKRTKDLASSLQMEMITLKNTKMVHIRNFDNDLQKMLRPTYIFEEEILPLFKHNLDHLVLSEKEKFLLVEYFYFHEDKVLALMKKYEFENFNHEFLEEIRVMLKKYTAKSKKKNRIKLTFEETLIYLNRVGMINDYGYNLFTNLFKYDNELVNAIYEIFIMTKRLDEFCENIKILKHSGYFKTDGAQADMTKAEKSYNLGQAILNYVDDLFKVYFSLEERRIIKKLIHEANEDLINFSKQNEHLTTKLSHIYTYYLSFNNQLRNFLELKKNKYGYGRKLSIKTESVFQFRGTADKEANKAAYEKVLRSEDFRVDSSLTSEN